jgi:tetratricopeptide (TPR) repeat protein
MRNSLASWVMVAAVFAARISHADDVKPYVECTHEPTETDLTAAKGAFQAGNASFDEADYPRALVYWEDAYRRDCTAHALLLNLARAYELNGNKPQAVVALETYLQRMPASPDRDKILRRVDVLKKQIEAEKAAAAAPPAGTPTTPAATPAAAAGATAGVKSEAPAASGSGGKRRIEPLILAGVGAGVAIVGIVIYGAGKSDLAAVEEKCPTHNCTSDQLVDEGNSARKRVNTGGVLAVLGLATTGAGLTWYFLQKPQPVASAKPSTQRALAPVVVPGYYGLSYAGRF